MSNADLKKVTVYIKTEFLGNVAKVEGKLIALGHEPFAQYERTPFVTFIPTGKRNAVKYRQTYKPYLLVVEGHGKPAPAAAFEEGKTENGMTTRRSRLSFDVSYLTDTDAVLDPLLASGELVALLDVRSTQAVQG